MEGDVTAATNGPIAIVGDTLITAASFSGGKGQTTLIAYRLGAHGSASPYPRVLPQRRRRRQRCCSVQPELLVCHTLATAHATGAVGPNLDQLKPSQALVRRQVTNGGGGMPAFGGRLSPAQIDPIAKYVASLAGK